MGFFDALNHLWSRSDFWNRQENAQQDAAYAAEQERKRREREQAAAQQQAAATAQAQQARQNATVTSMFGQQNPDTLLPSKPNPSVAQPSQLVRQSIVTPAQSNLDYNPDNTPRTSLDRAINTGADIAANVASGAGEGVARLVGSPLSLVSFGLRKGGQQHAADVIDSINAPSHIGNDIADARKQVDEEAARNGYNNAYKAGAVAGSLGLAIPTAGESLLPIAGKIAPKLPDVAAGLRTAAKFSGGKLLSDVRNARANYLDLLGNNPAEDAASSAGIISNNADEAALGSGRPIPDELTPTAPTPTEPVEVAPGVIKSPTAVTSRPPVVQPPVLPTRPVVTDTPTLPSLENPPISSVPASPADTTIQIPRVNNISPDIQKSVDRAVQQVIEDSAKPVPVPEKQTIAPVETPIQAASKEVPKVVAPPKDVTTRQMTPEEMAAKGMTQEQIDAVMARRANPESVIKPEPKPDPEVEAAKAERARAEAQAAADAGEGARTESRLVTQAQKDAHEQARVDAVKRVEAETAAKAAAKTVVEPKKTVPVSAEVKKPNVAQSSTTPVKEKTVVEPKPVAKSVETVEKPAVSSKMALQKGARENVTQGGKVKQGWINKQRAAGADPEQLRSAIEKVEGRKLPSKPKAPIATKPTKEGGIPLSGEKGLGQGAESSGKVMDKTSREVNVKQGKREAARKSTYKFLDEIRTKLEADHNAAFGVEERNAAEQLRKKFAQGSPEHNLFSSVIANVNQSAAQILATANRVMRDTATHDELMNRLVDRAKNIGYHLTEEDLADTKKATERFIERRSELNKAQEAFLKDDSSAEKLAAFKKAQQERDLADKEAKISELRAVASKEGDKAARQEMYKLIDKLGKEADVWQMDYIDTSLLSSTGTWVANSTNSGLGAIEEALFGKIGAKFAGKKTGATVGGGNPFTRKAQAFGFNRLKQEFQARKALPAKTAPGRLLNSLKNVVTTANELGNTQIDAGAYAATANEYRQILKAERPSEFGKGMTADAKKRLDNLVDYYATLDPRDIRQKYIDFGYKVQGMGGVLGKAGKSNVASFENWASRGLSNSLQGGGINKRVADAAGKLTTRVMLGFPTIITRSAGQGLRRSLGGMPTFWQARLAEDPVEKAMLIKQGIKELGSGGAMVATGVALAYNGEITGAYPRGNPTAKDEWAKEGKTEYAIKIGGSYHSIPRLFGPFAIPLLIGAQAGQSMKEGNGPIGGDIGGMAKNVVASIASATPVSQIADNFQTVNDLFFGAGDSPAHAAEKMAGNMVRILAPASSLLNEVAQSTVKYQKDTGSDNPVEAVLNQLYGSLPGLNQHLPDKTSNDGTKLLNVNPVARVFGAKSTENVAGVKDDMTEVKANNDRLSPILGDKDIADLLDDKTKKLMTEATNPKTETRLNDKNYASIYKAVSKTTDRLAEDGKWDAYGKTLQLKLNTQKADKTVPEDERDQTSRLLTQANLMRDNKIDPKIYHLYSASADKGGISSADFNKMVDPDSEYYDMDTAKKLWALDQLFTKNGVSGNTAGALNPWTKPKYTDPSKSGSGKSKQISTDFGKAGTVGAAGAGGLSLKYEALVNHANPIPNLAAQTAKTNLKKKISVAKGVRL